MMDGDGQVSSGQGTSPGGTQSDSAVPSTSSAPTQNTNAKKRKQNGSGDGKAPDADAEFVPEEDVNGTRQVRARRGYTTYPAFIFDTPPSQLTIEHLKRKYLIAEIERSDAEKLNYNRAVRFMAFMTESVRSFAGANGFKMPGSSSDTGTQASNDHGYSMGVHEDSADDDLLSEK